MPYPIEVFFEPLHNTKAQIAILAVMALMVLDLIVGIVGAVASKRFSSLRMRDGLLHKFMELASIALAVIFDALLLGGFDITLQPILIATCCYIIIAEAGSILELIKTYNPNTELFSFFIQFVEAKDSIVTVPVQIVETKQLDPDDTVDLGRRPRGE